MENTGYCERHQCPYEIKRVPGSWIFECPKCREEGWLDTYADNKTTMLPESEWTTNSHT